MITNHEAPPTSSNDLSQKKEEKREKKLHVTPDMWHMPRDMWHVTQDMWHKVGVNILSKFQIPSSYGLGKTVSWRFWKKGSLNEPMN